MLPAPRFEHLARMTAPRGLFEHALLSEPRQAHGFCLDDVARGLVVAVREPDPSPIVRELMRTYLRFTAQAQDGRGAFHNRRRTNGTWSDSPSTRDHWGRALWAAGTAVAHSQGHARDRALAVAAIGMQARSVWPRATAYAVLGAAEVLRSRPGDPESLRLMADARTILRGPGRDPAWPWPEPRLAYANAVLPEALMVLGVALDDAGALRDGLDLLGWLIDLQTRDGHLSVIPAGGWGPGEPLPGFDQQPIEAAALAEACWRAFEITGQTRWPDAVEACAAWFTGANDVGLSLYDESSGGCSDGLHVDRINRNQGAESTLAALSTLQLARRASLAAAR